MTMRRSIQVLIGTLIMGMLAASGALAQTDQGWSPRDLSGVWLLDGGTATFSAEPPPPMTDWAAERFAANRPSVGPNAVLDANDPTLVCLPPGIPYVLTIPTPFELIHIDGQLLQVFEYDHSLRRIYTDGRARPDDLHLTGMHQWMGYSIGRWDGDTLVIETSGFNDRTWLDRSGRPHSDKLLVTERLRRVDRETLVDDVTIHDPKAYTEPWHGRLVFKLEEDWQIFEHICVGEDNGSAEYSEYKERAWE
jgi:hypothetical protein